MSFSVSISTIKIFYFSFTQVKYTDIQLEELSVFIVLYFYCSIIILQYENLMSERIVTISTVKENILSLY